MLICIRAIYRNGDKMYYTFQNMQGKNFYFNGDNLKIYESLDLNYICLFDYLFISS